MRTATLALFATATLILGADCRGPSAEGSADPPNDARTPLHGYLVGPPQSIPPLGLPPRGVHPCAEDPAEARERLSRFFTAAQSLAERTTPFETRDPQIRVDALEEAIASARVSVLPFTFRIELEHIEEAFAEELRGAYEHLDRWFVLRCDVFDYINSAYGLTFHPVTDPFEAPASDRAVLKYAQLSRPLPGLDELEQIVDFLYKIGRIPLRGFNQGGELVGRTSFSEEGIHVVEDTVRWTVFDDAVVPDKPPTPPREETWVHVVLYDQASSEIAHTAFIVGEPEHAGDVFVFRDLEVGLDLIVVDQIEADRPHAVIRVPREGTVFTDRQRRVSFRGVASHARDMLLPEHMRWISDRDGFLGHGPTVNIDFADLSSGPHRLTFRVCDNSDRCVDATTTFVAP